MGSIQDAITAYCVRCRQKQPIQDAEAAFNQRGGPYTRGSCPVCGTGLTRFGRTPAHEGPEAAKPPPKPPEPRSGNLVIVESPAKARTIGRLLGNEYKVVASVGHVRDLLRSRLSVDIEDDFRPSYRVPNEKRAVVKELTAEAQRAEVVTLATDLDREGEAIAWHLIEAANIEPERTRRVVFHEITREAITEAFRSPGFIKMDLVNAQQARRILDRLVGYQISPLLWDRVRSRLTAGRVQSVAVRLIVEREREIEAFVPREYWTLEAELKAMQTQAAWRATLSRVRGERSDLPDEAAVAPVLADLREGRFVVSQVRTGERTRRPKAPFTTSTLQQAASGRLGFRAQHTMRVAQSLYEGMELDAGEVVGLITYMRTDSVHVAESAQEEARAWILEAHSADYVPGEPPEYRTRAKKAQEAHEAIRPTSVSRTPEAVAHFLDRDQARLYELVWRRFVASQMTPARYSTQRVEIAAGPTAYPDAYQFRAAGAQLIFPGFLAVYPEKADADEAQQLPALEVGEVLKLLRLIPEQHFTQPPPRFNEASLVRALEENGIGRPSTYAAIISTIQARGYVESDAGRTLRPTETGAIVNDLLVAHFPDVMSIGYTATVEDQLDRIAAGKTEWVPVIREFYAPFAANLAAAEKEMPRVTLPEEEVGRDCPDCGSPLVVKWGRFGRFIGCESYPACRHTEPFLDKIGVTCPTCGGDLVRKRTRKGRPFYGCATYPECNFTSWKLPLPAPCPACGGLLVVAKKDQAQCIACEESVALDSLESDN